MTDRAPQPNFTALQNVTRAMLEPLWLNSRVTAREIADQLGVSVSGVCKHAQTLGLPVPRPVRGRRKEGRERDAEFRRMWNAGVKQTEMAKHFGTSKGFICQKRIRLGLKPRTPRRGAGGYGGFGGLTLEQYEAVQREDAFARAVQGDA
jgi:hypothetical protein